MADLTGGQLIVAGTSGDFPIVCDAWFPHDDGLTQLWFGLNLEGDSTQIGGGDYIINQSFWTPTQIQIPMWFQGDSNRAGDAYDNVREGFESNLNDWRTEITDPSVVSRVGTLTLPSGATRTATMSKLQLAADGTGARGPQGWPLMFEFMLEKGPFA